MLSVTRLKACFLFEGRSFFLLVELYSEPTDATIFASARLGRKNPS